MDALPMLFVAASVAVILISIFIAYRQIFPQPNRMIVIQGYLADRIPELDGLEIEDDPELEVGNGVVIGYPARRPWMDKDYLEDNR